ncbi:hypothetical protein E1301_Tti008973 [Triplophysa tibetana]|uniref:Uncharacterized protein n=1 Tax=Triplophysa tibetana TaxID=1572043 RepID=A0A5A9P4A1_9TELE|nr:hypothetical protein E1301_Tti008973 [Triplophysa tibetana]
MEVGLVAAQELLVGDSGPFECVSLLSHSGRKMVAPEVKAALRSNSKDRLSEYPSKVTAVLSLSLFLSPRAPLTLCQDEGTRDKVEHVRAVLPLGDIPTWT